MITNKHYTENWKALCEKHGEYEMNQLFNGKEAYIAAIQEHGEKEVGKSIHEYFNI